MYKNTKEIPKTFQEFLDQGWDDRILYRINRFALKDILNSAEELLQDIYVSLLTTGYIEKYDPEKYRAFEVYLYVFVDNFLKGKYKREHTKNGFNIVNKMAIENTMPESSEMMDKNTLYLDSVNLADTAIAPDMYDGVEVTVMLEELRKELAAMKASSFNVYNGVRYNRDPLTVFDLMMEDYSVADIAKLFDTSSQFIYNLIKKIKQTDTAKFIMNIL